MGNKKWQPNHQPAKKWHGRRSFLFKHVTKKKKKHFLHVFFYDMGKTWFHGASPGERLFAKTHVIFHILMVPEHQAMTKPTSGSHLRWIPGERFVFEVFGQP